MYVCLCNAVTDHQIRECVNDGACSMRDLRQRLGVASQCGKCAGCAHQLLREISHPRQSMPDGFSGAM